MDMPSAHDAQAAASQGNAAVLSAAPAPTMPSKMTALEANLATKPKRVIKYTPVYQDIDIEATAATHPNARYLVEEDDEETRRVTVWNPKTGKKLSGNAGVFKKNLAKYLRTHPEWVVWTGQDKVGAHPRKRGFPADPLDRSPKRARLDPELYSKEKAAAIAHMDEVPTAASLWRSLLVVCSEKSILAEVAEDSEDESEEDRQSPYISRCYPSYKPFATSFVHGGLTSPAVG